MGKWKCGCKGGSYLVVYLLIKKWTGRVRLHWMPSKCTNVQLKFCLHNDHEAHCCSDYLPHFSPSLYTSLFSLLSATPYLFYLLSSSNLPFFPSIFPRVFVFLNASFLSLRVLLLVWTIWNHYMCRGEGQGPSWRGKKEQLMKNENIERKNEDERLKKRRKERKREKTGGKYNGPTTPLWAKTHVQKRWPYYTTHLFHW